MNSEKESGKVATFFVILVIIGALFIVAGKKEPQQSQLPDCKICHCHKQICSRQCSEENMCAMRCEKECGRK